MLVVARAGQGASARCSTPALSLLTTMFVHRGERGQAFGIYGGTAPSAQQTREATIQPHSAARRARPPRNAALTW
jgi:hypothetical protein